MTKKFANNLNYDGIEFSVEEKNFSKTEKKNNIYINVFFQKFENSIDLLLVIDENKSHYVHIKDFDRFMFHKTKNKNKRYFCKSCLQGFSNKNVLTEHKIKFA